MQTKTPKKILYLITKSNFGGAQKYVFELASAANAAGHTVLVACGGTGAHNASTGILVEKLREAHIPVHTVRNFIRDMSALSDVKAFFEVLTLIRKERPEVLHVTSSKAGGIGALAGRISGVPHIIFTSHGLTVDEVWRPWFERALIYIGTWITLMLSHKSIMISQETTNRAKQMPGLSHKIFLIKNGIAEIDFLDKAQARTELSTHIPQADYWIGGIGELHPNKNWEASILAMRSMSKNVHLVIIGEGEERRFLEETIAEHQLQHRVHLLGYKEGAKYLRAFDIFTLPSKKEGLPYVILEAGLASLPVVASDLPGNQDIIDSGQTGFLVPPTPQQLCATYEMLIRDEGMRRTLGKGLQVVVQDTFSIKRMYKETFALYDSNNSDDL
jgi:glycosyltransferase involved in cell wall biosynthesis